MWAKPCKHPLGCTHKGRNQEEKLFTQAGMSDREWYGAVVEVVV